jgi:hypothetical protein
VRAALRSEKAKRISRIYMKRLYDNAMNIIKHSRDDTSMNYQTHKNKTEKHLHPCDETWVQSKKPN